MDKFVPPLSEISGSATQVADIFTKALPRPTYESLCTKLGGIDVIHGETSVDNHAVDRSKDCEYKVTD